MAKEPFFLKSKYKSVPPSPEIEKVAIEFEVNGKIINRVFKPEEQVKERIEDFYSLYGDNGKAFLIRPSKMNFKSLMNEE